MRILVLLPGPLSGYSRVYEEVESLYEAGHAVTVIAWDAEGTDPHYPRMDVFEVISIVNSRLANALPRFFLKLRWWQIQAYRKAQEIHKRNPFDAVHCVNLASLHVGVRIKKQTGIPLIYGARELFFAYGGPKILQMSAKITERLLIPKVSRVICQNSARANAYAERYKLNRLPAVVLNVPKSFHVEPSPELRERLRVAVPDVDSKKILLYAGGIGPGRGLEKAVVEAGQFDERIIFVLVGQSSPGWDKYLKQLIREHKLTGKVAILPPVSRDLALRFMASADGGLVTYENVTLNNYLCAPVKLWELLHAGTPIVGCDMPEIAKIINKHKVGILFNWDTPGSMASAVNALLTNPELRGAMSLRIKRVASIYCWEREKDALLAVYKEFGH